MPFQSPYPEVPPFPGRNVTYLFNDPEAPSENDHVLHIDGLTGEKRTKNQFFERVYDGATALGAHPSKGGLGLGPSDMVGILSHNCLDYIAMIHALFCVTTPFALLSAFATPFELVHALKVSKSTRLFVEPSLLQNALTAAKEVGLPEDRIHILQGHVDGRKSWGEMIDDIKARGVPREPIRPVTQDTLAYLVFSSGTSGLPKAVMISHGNVYTSLAQHTIIGLTDLAEHEFDPDAPEPLPHCALAFLPFYHSYALHQICFRGFVAPMTFVIVPQWNPDICLDLIPKYQVTILLLVPSVIHQMVNHPKIHTTDFSTITHVASGAAYLPPELSKLLTNKVKGNGVTEGYGMSEATVSVARKPTKPILDGRVKPVLGSCGVLVPGMEGKIVRDDGTEADVNEPGELWVRGGNIALGYWGNEKATKESFVEGGWLRTGDKLRVDQDGLLYFEDRAKDTLKVSGLQVSPVEIENVLLAHPKKWISDVSVAGVSGGRTSDEKVPRAWIVLSEEGKKRGEPGVVKDLKIWSEKNLSKYKWLRGGFEVVDAIPKSPTGKVLRRVLQDKFEQTKAKSLPVQAKL